MTTTSISLPHGEHFGNTGDAPINARTSRLDIVRGLASCIVSIAKHRSIMRVLGPTGYGKSFTVGRALEVALGELEGWEPVWLDFSNWARGYALVREVYVSVTGDEHGYDIKSGPRLRSMLARELADRPRILVLDDAQWVNREALLMLAKLFDKKVNRACLVLIATDEFRARSPREFTRRTHYKQVIPQIATDEVVSTLTDYHPIFETADPDVLRTTNAYDAHGSFSWWAMLLQDWWDMRLQFPVLDETAFAVLVSLLKDAGEERAVATR